MPTSAILQPPKKKLKKKAKVAKKRQKIILVLSPSPSPSPPSPAMPSEPTSADEVNEGKDENIKEPIEVEDEDVGLLSPPPPAHFISVWKAVIGNKKESLPNIRLAVFNTKSICYFKLDKWQNKTILYLLL